MLPVYVHEAPSPLLNQLTERRLDLLVQEDLLERLDDRFCIRGRAQGLASFPEQGLINQHARASLSRHGSSSLQEYYADSETVICVPADVNGSSPSNRTRHAVGESASRRLIEKVSGHRFWRKCPISRGHAVKPQPATVTSACSSTTSVGLLSAPGQALPTCPQPLCGSRMSPQAILATPEGPR
jgi:hypothetical protein